MHLSVTPAPFFVTPAPLRHPCVGRGPAKTAMRTAQTIVHIHVNNGFNNYLSTLSILSGFLPPQE